MKKEMEVLNLCQKNKIIIKTTTRTITTIKTKITMKDQTIITADSYF